MVLRSIKIMVVTGIALFFTLVAYGNIIDYPSNWAFVQHVLSMDTTFKSPALMTRQILDPNIQAIAYWLIIGTEIAAALFCWLGAAILLWHRHDAKQFSQKKKIANLGLAIGLFLYLFCFLIIAGEWFAMWQSTQWNAEQTASYLSLIILLSLVFLNQESPEKST